MRTGSRTASALILSLLLLLAAALPSCKENPVIGLIAAFKGASVTSTEHEFTKDEFYVVASYEDGTFEQDVTDYEFEVVGLAAGYYTIRFTYKGYSTETYVQCSVPVYPSDIEGGE